MIGLQLVEIINGTTECTAPRTGTACDCFTAVAVALDGRTKGLAESLGAWHLTTLLYVVDLVTNLSGQS
jgi:hypothetical protein